ncbi:hypothetical protein BH10BAC2_BH10BAC2_18760 [soil metagenome]
MKTEGSYKKLCSQPAPIQQPFAPNISGNRLKFIITTNKKWVNGTEIKYMFIHGPEAQCEVVRNAFNEWKDLGIGITFKEVNNVDDSLVRIGFNLNDGSWSYVGRDVLTISKSKTTMNFGWDLTANSYGRTTALHEIGHTIGFQHEHQSPFSGIEWDEESVYREFSGPPNNWEKSEIDSNIIHKISPNQVKGSQWDADSIMEYEFGPGLVKKPTRFQAGIFPPGLLSELDIEGVKSFYPAIDTASFEYLHPLKSTTIKAASGEQADFLFKAPLTKKYTFQTFGDMDTVMVISEKGKNETHYLSGDDDSGFDKNTKIQLPLVKGREYLINVRVMYAGEEGNSGIVVF